MTQEPVSERAADFMGDPEADLVVSELFASGQVASASHLLKELVRNTMPSPGDAPQVVRDYLSSERALPDWADRDLILIGENVFSKYCSQISLSLYSSVMAEGYLHWRMAHILHLTARLETNAFRRISETVQLVLDVMAPGGLGPGGAGIATVLRVRLMHAAIRHLITERAREDPSIWDSSWGTPISQRDLATVILGYSVLVIDDLASLGIKLSQTEEEGYLHAWCVVGHFIGVEREFLPQTVAEGRKLYESARRTYYRPTPAGLELERALVELMTEMLPRAMYDMPLQYIRFFIGDAYADLLEVPRPPGWRRRVFGTYVRLHRRFAWLAGETGFMDSIAPMSRALLVSMVDRSRGGERPAFAIPEALREPLQVPPSAR
ncbi:MAG: DUF2236 domain-containing protein [Chloroflexi bacterium]|nr:DUF2236 domain-containing protein [Chloroflexota bacterium]